MSDLIIGNSVPNFTGEVCPDLFLGLALLEKRNFRIVVFNLGHVNMREEEVIRIQMLLSRRKMPAVFITDDPKFQILESLDFVEVIPSGLVSELLDDAIRALLRYKSLEKKLLEISKQKRRPLLLALGLLMLLEPAIKIGYLCVTSGFALGTVMDICLSINDPIKVLEFWALFPLTGIALMRPAWWSVFVFLGAHCYTFYALSSYEQFTWPYVQESPHISANLLLVFNTALVIYMLFPENRRPFTRKAASLFRGTERIKHRQDVLIRGSDASFCARLSNISRSGALILTSEKLTTLDHGSLEIDTAEGKTLSIPFSIVRGLSSQNGANAYGIRFIFNRRREKKLVKEYLSTIEPRQAA